MKKKISLVLIALIILVSILGTFCFAKEIQPRTSGEDGIMPISETAPEEDETTPCYIRFFFKFNCSIGKNEY